MSIPFDRVIWTAEECAAYLGQSYSQFMKRTQHIDGFPKRCPSHDEPRWSAKAVSDWVFSKDKPGLRDYHDRPGHLYRHFDEDGALLYVGVSLSVAHRTANHAINANWFASVRTITVEHFTTMAFAREAERAAIKTEKPLHNQRLNRA